jgi:hypothetical protein
MGNGMEMGRSVYEQPGTEVDRILSQQGGFQVSKGKQKGIKEEWERKKQKARGLHYNCTDSIFVYIMNACNVWMIPVTNVYIIIAGLNVVNNLNCVRL